MTGLEYSYNTPALSDDLAICFAYPGEPTDCLPSDDVPWLSAAPDAGTLGADSTRGVTVTFAFLSFMPEGVYTATLEIRTRDDGTPRWYVPMTLTVLESQRFYLPIMIRR